MAGYCPDTSLPALLLCRTHVLLAPVLPLLPGSAIHFRFYFKKNKNKTKKPATSPDCKHTGKECVLKRCLHSWLPAQANSGCCWDLPERWLNHPARSRAGAEPAERSAGRGCAAAAAGALSCAPSQAAPGPRSGGAIARVSAGTARPPSSGDG